MYLAEKGLSLEIEELELHKQNRTGTFRRKNVMANLPVLELDDGTCISESIAICRYLETLYPSPSLFGESALQIATIEMWNRRAEFALYMPIEFAGGFLGEEVASGAIKRVEKTLQIFDDQLAETHFLTGGEISVADITTKVALDFGVRFNGIEIPSKLSNFKRWNENMDQRSSANV